MEKSSTSTWYLWISKLFYWFSTMKSPIRISKCVQGFPNGLSPMLHWTNLQQLLLALVFPLQLHWYRIWRISWEESCKIIATVKPKRNMTSTLPNLFHKRARTGIFLTVRMFKKKCVCILRIMTTSAHDNYVNNEVMLWFVINLLLWTVWCELPSRNFLHLLLHEQ